METPNSPDGFASIKRALADGKKIEAIRLYREQMNVGLAEAKAAVEAMEAGTWGGSGAGKPMGVDHTDAIQAAIFAGRKIEAIKLYREQTRVGLAEAKAAVEAMEVQMRGGSGVEAVKEPDYSEAIRAALFAGRKIEAIKLYREQCMRARHQVGLAEAKAAVEEMESQLRRASPERFSQVQSKGCFGVVLVLAHVGVLLWKLFT